MRPSNLGPSGSDGTRARDGTTSRSSKLPHDNSASAQLTSSTSTQERRVRRTDASESATLK
eukprot:7040813-Prymnesium_polylepis.2